MSILKAAPSAIALFFVVVSSFAQKHPDSLCVFSSDISPADISINPSGLLYSPHNEQKIDFGIITHNKWCYIVIKK